MDPEKTKHFVSHVYETTGFKAIEQYIAIPNCSPDYDPDWKTNGHQDAAVKHLLAWIDANKVPALKVERIQHGERTPIIMMELDASQGCKGTDTVLMYGHLDKQPPMAEAWSAGLHPYKPVYKDGKLYGRGGADDGYSTFAAVIAINALYNQRIPHSRIVVVIEACEESGSPDLEYYVNTLSERIGQVGLVVCLDSGCGNYEQFWLTTSLRGIAAGVLNVTVLNQAMHSGSASGVVPDSFRIARHILDRIEDAATGRVLLAEATPAVPEARVKQAHDSAAVLGNVVWNEFPWASTTKPMGTDNGELLLNKTWRSTLTVTGAAGWPPIEKAGNVLRTSTSLKLSVRLPPHANATAAVAALEREVTRDPPYGATVTLTGHDAAAGWAAPLLAPWLEKSINSAAQAVFGKPPLQFGEGGSIPFMGMLGAKFPKAQFVVTGVLGPGSNAHGPDEFLHLEMTKNVTAVVAHVLGDFYKSINIE